MAALSIQYGQSGFINIVLVNSETSNSVHSFHFAMFALPASVSPWSWTHVLMDGDELDGK